MSYSFDLIKRLVADLRKDGFTSEEITAFRSRGRLRAFRGVIRGTHEIRPIEHVIDLSVSCKLPFDGAERISPSKSGVVRLERRDDDLYLDDQKIELILSERQKDGKMIVGHELRIEREELGGNLSARILDYLVEHPELWPESWKKDDQGRIIYVFFWDDIFCYPERGNLNLYVRYGYWCDDRMISDHRSLYHEWGGRQPAASLAVSVCR